MTQITNKLERQQLNKKHTQHTHQHLDGWTNFTVRSARSVKPSTDSYRMKVEKAKTEEWK